MINKDFSQIMESSVSTIETTNNIDANSNDNLSYHQTCNICPPRKDTYYTISQTIIKKLKVLCEKHKNPFSIVSDILLFFASLFLGTIFSAIISKVEFKPEFIPILFYCVSPALGLACLIAFIFTKRISKDSEIKLAEKVNEYIVEPFELSQKENNDGH